MNRKMLFVHSQKALRNVTASPYQETLSLLSFFLQTSPSSLLAHLDYSISEAQREEFFLLIKRRSQGEPLAYLRKQCEFWSSLFTVTPDCLIPRQDTELLVERVLTAHANSTAMKVLELGTGSGAVAIAINLERPNWQITATDQSAAALKVAAYNGQQLGTQVCFMQGNWFEAIAKQKASFDIIISNPPYLSNTDPHLQSSLRYEPKMALVAGQTGTEILRHLVLNAINYLKPGGYLYLEQGFDQGETVKSYLTKNSYTNIQQYTDIQSIIRVSCGQYGV